MNLHVEEIGKGQHMKKPYISFGECGWITTYVNVVCVYVCVCVCVCVEVGDSIFETSFNGGKMSLLFYKPYLSCIRKICIVFVDEELPARS